MNGTLATLFRRLLRVRLVEERLAALFAAGEIPGFLHLGLGQEAVPVGVAACLGPQDTIASTHRGHGHALAKGVDLAGFFAELLGLENGLCRGRGGSMHVADLSIGMLGANGIVGAGLPIALGSALAHKTLRRAAIAVAFFGDGAQAEGTLHETLNLAATWRVPLLLVCENNGWSEFTPGENAFRGSLSGLAAAFGIPYRRVEGSDVEAVVEAASRSVAEVRGGGAPGVLECTTHRFDGHFAGDPQRYRGAEDLAGARAIDPVAIAAARLDEAEVAAIRADVVAEIEAALATARQGRQPDPAGLLVTEASGG